MSDANVTRGDKVITGNLYIGGEIINAALTATILAAFPLYDALTYQGVISALATFPAASKGDLYKCTAAGSIGGTGPTVAVGDIVICNTDDTLAGTYAAVGASWDIIPSTNIDSLNDLLTSTAENDFIVAGPAATFTWLKKTLAEVKTILGLGSAAYTASTAYPTHAQAIAENDVLVGGPNPFGAWVKKTIAEFKTILGLGTAAYVATGTFDAAGTAAAALVDSALTGATTAIKISPTLLCIAEKTPVNAVAASRILTFTGQPTEKEKVTIGATIYEFHTAIGAGVKASGALTFTGNAVDNETVTIDGQAYTFANAIAAGGVAAHGHLTLTGNAVENEVVVLGAGAAAKTYRWRDQIAAIAAFKTLTFTAVAANTETVTIDTTTYTFVTALTEAKATSILTLSANATDGNSVTIGSTKYTFKEVLGAAYDVLIGALATNTIDNLIAAINAAAGEGSTYGTGTVVHPTVTAAAGAGDTMGITSKTVGVASNSIATTELSTVCSWTGATMAGGVDPILNQVLVEGTAEAEINNLVAACTGGAGEGTKYATGQTAHATVTVTKTDAANILATAVVAGTAGNSIAIAETCAQVAWTAGAVFLGGGYALAVANDVIIGGTAQLSIDALVAAVNAAAGEGTTYGTGTTIHSTITATKTAVDIFTGTAKANGDAGNAEVTTTDMSAATWAAATLAGGEDPDTSYIVLIGATKEDSIDNLVSAITDGGGIGTGEGTLYGTGTAPHPSVTATRALAVMTVEALAVGDAGNLIAISKVLALATWAGAGFLTLGDDAQEAYDVLISAVNTEGSIDNLVAAIAGTGDGTTCGNGTDAHPLVTAVKTDTDKVTATAIIKGGTTGNAIATESTVILATWPSGFMTGGVDGTVGVANESCADATYLYHCVAANTIADANWRRVALGSAF